MELTGNPSICSSSSRISAGGISCPRCVSGGCSWGSNYWTEFISGLIYTDRMIGLGLSTLDEGRYTVWEARLTYRYWQECSGKGQRNGDFPSPSWNIKAEFQAEWAWSILCKLDTLLKHNIILIHHLMKKSIARSSQSIALKLYLIVELLTGWGDYSNSSCFCF